MSEHTEHLQHATVFADVQLPADLHAADLTHLVPIDAGVGCIHHWPTRGREKFARLWLSDEATLAQIEALKAHLEQAGCSVELAYARSPRFLSA